MRRVFATALLTMVAAFAAYGQGAVDAPKLEEKRKADQQVAKEQNKVAQAAENVQIVGATAFKDEELRNQLKEQITAINELGLTPARGDDAAFFLELYYRRNGYEKAEVRYAISGNRLRLEIDEGPRVTLGNINFVGNEKLATDKLFEFVVGPTRERYGKTERALPFVPADVEEGVELVRRLYISEGYLNAIVQVPKYTPREGGTVMDANIAIVEGRRYAFDDINFTGRTVFPPEELREEMADLLVEPYTDRRLADIPRRLEALYKKRGYYAVKVDATGNPDAARGGRVPVNVVISPGVVHYFDGVTVTGLQQLRPSYVTKRFSKLSGKPYSPEALDERFREMMKSGLFNVLQIKPEAVGGNQLHLRIAAEEAKTKEFGLSVGAGTYAGLIVGTSYRDRNLFGYGRPLTTSAEYSSRGYKGEVLWEDPYLFDTDYELKVRLYSLTFEFDGYSKLEFGGRIDLARQWTKQYRGGAFFLGRNVEVTSARIPEEFLGRRSYQVNSFGLSQTLDLRKNALVAPRGFIFDSTFDYASSAFGSQLEFVRSTARATYYLSFAPEKQVVNANPDTDPDESGWRRWFEKTQLAVGARAGVIKGPNGSEIPIDERFFNGGGTTVRSFAERELGPRFDGDPLGGEFYSVYNIEYTFPIWGELSAAVFIDAGNLTSSDQIGFTEMRYAVGMGLRYQLPIGPLRIDYGVNPSPHDGEAFGAFHFSFGFAF
jgi:outer membrane protein assembly factor BamA